MQRLAATIQRTMQRLGSDYAATIQRLRLCSDYASTIQRLTATIQRLAATVQVDMIIIVGSSSKTIFPIFCRLPVYSS